MPSYVYWLPELEGAVVLWHSPNSTLYVRVPTSCDEAKRILSDPNEVKEGDIYIPSVDIITTTTSRPFEALSLSTEAALIQPTTPQPAWIEENRYWVELGGGFTLLFLGFVIGVVLVYRNRRQAIVQYVEEEELKTFQ